MTSHAVSLPEGTDLHDPYTRAKVEAKVKDNLGQSFEVLWPRPGEQTNEVTAVDARPGAQRVTLSADVKATMGPQVFANLRNQGLQMVEFNPYDGFAIACEMDSQTVDIRNRLATVLKTEPWNLEVVCSSVFDEKLGRPRLDKVCIVRSPSQGISADKRLTTWRELISMLRDGGTGWSVEEDSVSGQVQLSYGTPRRLPDFVGLSDLLPDSVRPEEWAKVPLGFGAEGKPVFLDLLSGPHGLFVGPTGTGKTVLLLTHAVNALARGHRVIMIDPTKAGLDFKSIKPWCSGWADTLAGGQAMVEAVYAEVSRRKAILQELGEVKWSDVNPEMARKHQIFPTTVILDEYGSLVIEETVPKSLPKDHPYRVESDERNASRAIISSLVGRIAREARFAGIHLAIALQRPDAGIISGELRSNLTSAVQLSPPGKPLSREALTMVFPGEVGPQAAEVLSELDDGVSRGLAVTASEGGTAAGFRVAFAKASSIPEMLERLGIPFAEPLQIAPSRTRVEPVIDFEVIKSAVVKTEDVHHGSLDFTLDDLENDTDTRPDPSFATARMDTDASPAPADYEEF